MNRLNLKTIIFSIITLVGLALSVYLVLNYQTILSRAGSSDYASFDVKDAQDKPLSCTGDGVCDTQTLDVKLQIKDLEKLSE